VGGGVSFRRDRLTAERIAEVESEDFTTVPMRLGESLVDWTERVRQQRAQEPVEQVFPPMVPLRVGESLGDFHARVRRIREQTGVRYVGVREPPQVGEPLDTYLERVGILYPAEDETTDEEDGAVVLSENETTEEEETAEEESEVNDGFFTTLSDGHFEAWTGMCMTHDITRDPGELRWVMQRRRGEAEETFIARVSAIQQFRTAHHLSGSMSFDYDEESFAHYTLRWEWFRFLHGIVRDGGLALTRPPRNRWAMYRRLNETHEDFDARVARVSRYRIQHGLLDDPIAFYNYEDNRGGEVQALYPAAADPVHAWRTLCESHSVYSDAGRPVVPRRPDESRDEYMVRAGYFNDIARGLGVMTRIRYDARIHTQLSQQCQEHPPPTWEQMRPGDVAGPDFPTPQQMQRRAARRTRARRNACDLQ
jgi:hypothetical protein